MKSLLILLGYTLETKYRIWWLLLFLFWLLVIENLQNHLINQIITIALTIKSKVDTSQQLVYLFAQH
jgi:hypothetical protein